MPLSNEFKGRRAKPWIRNASCPKCSSKKWPVVSGWWLEFHFLKAQEETEKTERDSFLRFLGGLLILSQTKTLLVPNRNAISNSSVKGLSFLRFVLPKTAQKS